LGILFSGGIDSVIIASIAADVFLSTKHTLTKIHLINVASASMKSPPDRSTGIVSYGELLTKFPSDIFEFIAVDIEESEIRENETRILSLASPNNSHMDFNISTALWFGGRGRGRVLDPSFIEDSRWQSIRDRIVQEESVESAVENRTSKKDVSSAQTSPICSTCGKHKYKPGCLNSACKFCCKKFAQNGTCRVHRWNPHQNDEASVQTKHSTDTVDITKFVSEYLSADQVTSDCRILLVGHGADELFGGYGRHETRSRVGGLSGLRSEMLLDLGRLWQRNLGRDDRVLSDNARDTRHPFLDEQVIEWVSKQTIASMCDGKWNKPLLRGMATEILGMEIPANFRKRAIQFGTRLAQQANLSCFGSHSQGSGAAKYIAPDRQFN
jgi:asparagine synthetase B (glutamine-hydrolysing)